MDSELHSINQQYAIPSQLSFHTGPGGLVMAVINNTYALATITLAGAHVMTYRPHSGREVLWTSPGSAYELSNAMRGGIPVCWPWFAQHPTDPRGMPLHGLVRTQIFQVAETQALPDGGTELRMTISDTPSTHILWPHSYNLEVSVRLGSSLAVEWVARNTGSQSFQYTGALHPYFFVSDVHELTLRGLEGTKYIDTNDNDRRKTQSGPIRFPGRIDNIYLDTDAEMRIEDPGFQRIIHVRKSGSRTSVVWNPDGEDTFQPDVGEGQHQFFVCAEAANAQDDVVTVEPGGEARLEMEIEIEEWRPA